MTPLCYILFSQYMRQNIRLISYILGDYSIYFVKQFFFKDFRVYFRRVHFEHYTYPLLLYGLVSAINRGFKFSVYDWNINRMFIAYINRKHKTTKLYKVHNARACKVCRTEHARECLLYEQLQTSKMKRSSWCKWRVGYYVGLFLNRFVQPWEAVLRWIENFFVKQLPREKLF